MSASKLSRRDFLRGAAGATAVATLAPVAGAVSASAPQQDEIVLNMWNFATNRFEWMGNFIEELWAPAYPNVTVNVEITPHNDLWPKLQAVFAGGTGIPDIVDVGTGRLGQFMHDPDNEPFIPLDDRLGDQLNDLTIVSGTKTWTVRDRIFGIGNEVNPVLLYYRHDLFDEMGLDAEAPGTWQEFVDQLGPAVRDAGTGLFPVQTQNWSDFFIQYHQAGGQFFDTEGNVLVHEDPLAAEVLAWQKAQLDSGVYVEQGAGVAQYALMNEGAYVSIWGAPWYQGFMKQRAPDLAGKWKMRYLPVWAEGGHLTVPRGGTGMCITAASEIADTAWDFIREANLTVEGSLLAFRRMNLFPSYKPAWDEEVLYRTDDYFSGQKPAEFIATAAEAMAPAIIDNYWSLLIDSLARIAVQGVMLEGSDPAAALAEAVDDFEFNK